MSADGTAGGSGTGVRLPLPDAMRGVAALAVALFHFSSGVPIAEPIAVVARWGWLGVDAFFVLSGFVISSLLLRGAVHALGFLARRLARLLPPCIAVFLLVETLDLASTLAPAYAGVAWAPPSWASVVCHATVSCAAFGIEWNNPVLWSLAVELQFYALAVLLAVAARPGPGWRRLVALALAVGVLSVVDDAWFARYLPSFALGFAAAAWREPRVMPAYRVAAGALAAAFAIALQDVPIAVVACAVAALLARAAGRSMPRMLLVLGALSYSFYLVHVPVGGRVLNLLARQEPGPIGALAMIACAALVALLASWALWRWVERPAIAWSRRIADQRPLVDPSPGPA